MRTARDRIALWISLLWLACRPLVTPAAAAQAVLTPAERAWVRTHPVLTLALAQNNPPLNFRRADAAGATYAGASLDYAELVARNTGLRFRYTGSSWEEALRKGMAHEVDGVLCARDLPERKTRLNFSDPYLELPIAMAVRGGHVDARTLAAFGGQRIAVVRSTVRVPVLRTRCPDCELVEVADPQEGATLVLGGQADGLLDDLPVAQRAAGGKLKIGLVYYFAEAATIRFALRNDAPELLAIVNKGLAAITPAEHELIRTRWLGAAQGVPARRELPLSPAQQAWLARRPVLRVAVDVGRPPIEWRGEDGILRGISVDIMRRMELMLNTRFELVPSINIADQLAKARRKEVDLVSAIAHAPERAGYLSVTEPFLSTPTVIFSRVGEPPPGGLSGLAGKRVGVSARSNIEERLRKDWPAIVPVQVGNFREATELLRAGGIDALVGPLLTGTHQLVETGASDIRVAGETDYSYRVGYGVRADLPELLPIIELALAAIERDEREAIRQKWTTVQFSHELDYRPLALLLMAVVVATAFIVQLRVMVRRRTAELQGEVGVRRAREEEIQRLNTVLEQRVHERTAQLTQANEDLRLAAEQLVQTEKVASLGRLVAGIAHELNTPLGSSLTAATTMRDLLRDFGAGLVGGGLRRSQAEEFLRQCQQACGIIERNTHRASGLIENFKELAVDQASVRRRPFRLRHTVEEVIATHRNAWKKTPHRIALDIPEEIELDSYPGPLAQVLSNLLENTLVHGFAASAGGTVTILASVDGERVCLSYGDDGAGIPAEHCNKIYDPFFTTRMGQGGSGLGLYIVQTLVSGVLGGTIAVHSEAGLGTRFHITLPLVAPDSNDSSGAHGAVAVPRDTPVRA
ncbi:transporter substrate-binding domain-containing protein [Pseudoduganella namucuonensis]|uniref:histidine kinase n=1 Tax=Pseudoduganella namucuonensis TaxID=1035707 RepID=A0A1I7L9Q6_9BURK|nr:transporter substrate-binding domain-containing protein [Pseudoduganella namucuonensis]SFV06425.1 Signal transduction histidine kinase [Pseudoduganella namucuonensis]